MIVILIEETWILIEFTKTPQFTILTDNFDRLFFYRHKQCWEENCRLKRISMETSTITSSGRFNNLHRRHWGSQGSDKWAYLTVFIFWFLSELMGFFFLFFLNRPRWWSSYSFTEDTHGDKTIHLRKMQWRLREGSESTASPRVSQTSSRGAPAKDQWSFGGLFEGYNCEHVIINIKAIAIPL